VHFKEMSQSCLRQIRGGGTVQGLNNHLKINQAHLSPSYGQYNPA